MKPQSDPRTELERMRRVSDQCCTAHASLRDRFAFRALMLDLTIIALSVWGVALVFVDPLIHARLTPFGLEPIIWLGLLAIATLFLTVLQLRVDWKGRSEAHKRSLRMYADVKAQLGAALNHPDAISAETFDAVSAKYALAGEYGIEIGESDFLVLKQRHLTKVEISKLLDGKPFASILLTRLKLFMRDNRDSARGQRNAGSEGSA